MIHPGKRSLHGVALSAVLLGSVLASAGLPSSPASASNAATTTKVTTFTDQCNTGIANGTVSVTTTQTYPTSVVAGSTFTITWKSVTTVSGALASAAYGLAPNGSEKGTVTLDNDLSSNASPSTSNIAGSKGLKEQGKINSPSSFPIYTPKKTATPPTFTTPPFTAGTAGTTDKVTPGADDATIDIYNSSGTLVTTTTADCTPVSPAPVIASVKVVS